MKRSSAASATPTTPATPVAPAAPAAPATQKVLGAVHQHSTNESRQQLFTPQIMRWSEAPIEESNNEQMQNMQNMKNKQGTIENMRIHQREQQSPHNQHLSANKRKTQKTRSP